MSRDRNADIYFSLIDHLNELSSRVITSSQLTTLESYIGYGKSRGEVSWSDLEAFESKFISILKKNFPRIRNFSGKDEDHLLAIGSIVDGVHDDFNLGDQISKIIYAENYREDYRPSSRRRPYEEDKNDEGQGLIDEIMELNFEKFDKLDKNRQEERDAEAAERKAHNKELIEQASIHKKIEQNIIDKYDARIRSLQVQLKRLDD